MEGDQAIPIDFEKALGKASTIKLLEDWDGSDQVKQFLNVSVMNHLSCPGLETLAWQL